MNLISNKIDKNELDNLNSTLFEFKRECNLKLQANDNDFEKLIGNVKSEFKNITEEMNSLGSNIYIYITNKLDKKVELKDLDKINLQLSKKLDAESLNSFLNMIKLDTQESVLQIKKYIMIK